MNRIYKCKCHNKPYMVCTVCQHQYCDQYWISCPRCYERKHGYPRGIEAIRKPFYPSAED